MMTTTDLGPYQQLIKAMVYKVTKPYNLNPDDFTDLVSDVNLKLLDKSLAEYDPKKGMSISTYIGMVAKRHAIDFLRKRKEAVTKTGDMSNETQDIWSPQADALGRLIKLEQAAKLRQAISTLKGEDRDLCEAMLEHDFSTEDYAKKRGVSTNSVYVRRCRVLARLRTLLTSSRQS